MNWNHHVTYEHHISIESLLFQYENDESVIYYHNIILFNNIYFKFNVTSCQVGGLHVAVIHRNILIDIRLPKFKALIRMQKTLTIGKSKNIREKTYFFFVRKTTWQQISRSTYKFNVNHFFFFYLEKVTFRFQMLFHQLRHHSKPNAEHFFMWNFFYYFFFPFK